MSQNNQSKSHLVRDMEALVRGMKQMMAEEFGQFHRRLDRLENFNRRPSQGVHPRTEQIVINMTRQQRRRGITKPDAFKGSTATNSWGDLNFAHEVMGDCRKLHASTAQGLLNDRHFVFHSLF